VRKDAGTWDPESKTKQGDKRRLLKKRGRARHSETITHRHRHTQKINPWHKGEIRWPFPVYICTISTQAHQRTAYGRIERRRRERNRPLEKEKNNQRPGPLFSEVKRKQLSGLAPRPPSGVISFPRILDRAGHRRRSPTAPTGGRRRRRRKTRVFYFILIFLLQDGQGSQLRR
jgi:hypothetical protein